MNISSENLLKLSSKKRHWQAPRLEKLQSDEIAGDTVNVQEAAGGVLDAS